MSSIKIYTFSFDPTSLNQDLINQANALLPEGHQIPTGKAPLKAIESAVSRLKLMDIAMELDPGRQDLMDWNVGLHGKPSLKNNDWYFNYSHSEGCIAIVTSEQQVGIDIQKHRKISNAILDRVLCEEEQEWLQKQQNATLAFFDQWTQKEAIVKCDGDGIQLGLKSINTLEKKTLLRDQYIFSHVLPFEEGYSLSLASTYNFDQNNISIKRYEI